jgi:hypothetical protein
MEPLQPAISQAFLTAIVQEMGCVPPSAARIQDQHALPARLEELTKCRSNREMVWSAWSSSRHTWFFRVEQVSDELGAPVVSVNSYDEKGRLEDSTIWVRDCTCKWLQTLARSKHTAPLARMSRSRSRFEKPGIAG